MKKFVKVFGAMSALMGVFFAIYWTARGMNPAFAIVLGAVAGAVIFGGVFAMRMIENRIKGKSFGSHERKLSHVFKIKMTAKEAEGLCRRALSGLGTYYSLDPDASNPPHLMVCTRQNSRAHGEIVTIRIRDNSESSVTIDISSESVPRESKEEIGSNRNNVETLCRFINNAIEPENVLMSARIDPAI